MKKIYTEQEIYNEFMKKYSFYRENRYEIEKTVSYKIHRQEYLFKNFMNHILNWFDDSAVKDFENWHIAMIVLSTLLFMCTKELELIYFLIFWNIYFILLVAYRVYWETIMVERMCKDFDRQMKERYII